MLFSPYFSQVRIKGQGRLAAISIASCGCVNFTEMKGKKDADISMSSEPQAVERLSEESGRSPQWKNIWVGFEISD